MRHIYRLQKVLQKRPTKVNLVSAASGLCETAMTAVLNVNSQLQEKAPSTSNNRRTGASTPTKASALTTVLRGIDVSFGLLRQVLDKLSGLEDRHNAGQVTYQTVCLFDSIVVSLRRHCGDRAKEDIANTTRTSGKSKNTTSTAKSRMSKGGQHNVEPASSDAEGEVAVQMTRLLGMMVLSLNMSRVTHRNLLEGFAFMLIRRVGELLCLFVFQDLHLRHDLRVDNDLKFPLPRGLGDGELHEATIQAAQMEAKHLVWLLERVLIFLDVQSSSAQSSSSMNTQEGTERADFVSTIKEKLQSTLLQAVFGDDDPLFQKSLQCPVCPENLELNRLRDYVQVPERAVPDWFTQEIWRLLGWDMLAGIKYAVV